MSDGQQGKIFRQMAKAMLEIEAVPKDSINTQQNFRFRSVDAVYAMMHDVLARNGIFSAPSVLDVRSEERQSRSGGVLIYRTLRVKYTFYADDGSSFESIVDGEGMDSGDKASNKAMSAAHKYCLLQTFCIPTSDDKDGDKESPEPIPKTQNGAEKVGASQPQAAAVGASSSSSGPMGSGGPTEAQIRRLHYIRKKSNYSEYDVRAFIKGNYNIASPNDLSRSQYNETCSHMENHPKAARSHAPSGDDYSDYIDIPFGN